MVLVKFKPATLTKRQVQLLQLVADGYSSMEIAQQLSLTHQSVKNMIFKVTRRLGVSNRAHAVALAIGCGLIQARGENSTRWEDGAIAEIAERRSHLRFEGIDGEYILVFWRNAKGQVASIEIVRMSGKKASRNELERFFTSERVGNIEFSKSANKGYLTGPD